MGHLRGIARAGARPLPLMLGAAAILLVLAAPRIEDSHHEPALDGSQRAADDVAFVALPSAPEQPPTVVARSTDGHGSPTDERAVLYTSADWTGVPIRKPTTPVPWPAERLPSDGHVLLLEFAPGRAPDYLLIQAYNAVDPATGVPIDQPSFVFGCDRFQAADCPSSDGNDRGVVGPLDVGADAPEYVVVFGSWVQDGASVDAPPHESTASWIFRLGVEDTQRPPAD